jgi:hypothetical protein
MDDQGGKFRPFFIPAEPPSEGLIPASLQVISGWLKASWEPLRRTAWDAALRVRHEGRIAGGRARE